MKLAVVNFVSLGTTKPSADRCTMDLLPSNHHPIVLPDEVILNLNSLLFLQLFEILELQRKQLHPFFEGKVSFDFLDN